MKRFFTSFSLFFILTQFTFAASGIFEKYLFLNVNGSDMNGVNGANLGTISSLTLKGGEVKTWKNGGSNVTGAGLQYKMYKQGSTPPGSFTYLNIPFGSNLDNVVTNQSWYKNNANTNLFTNVTSNGTWVLEFYFEAYTSDGNKYDNCGSSSTNCQVTFTVTVLPIALSYLNVINSTSTNFVKWETLSESNSLNFNIQRSSNNQTWQTIGTVKATNNPTGAKYNFTDDAPLSTVNYYRLQMVDRDGKMDYSKVIAVSGNGDKKSLSVYPNPVKTELTLLTDGNTAGGTIYDMTGKIVHQFNDNRSKVNVSDLPNGVYFVRILDKNGWVSEAVRFVKQ